MELVPCIRNSGHVTGTGTLDVPQIIIYCTCSLDKGLLVALYIFILHNGDTNISRNLSELVMSTNYNNNNSLEIEFVLSLEIMHQKIMVDPRLWSVLFIFSRGILL